MPFVGGDDMEMDHIDPIEHMKDLNTRQKATIAQAVVNQKKYDDLRAEYRKELDALEAKYKKLEEPIFQERCKIVAGESELEGVDIPADKLEEMKGQEAHLPNFWFHVLRNNDNIRALCGLSDSDKEAMSYIRDVVCEAIPLREEEIEVDDDDECCCGEEGCECKKEKDEEKKEGEKKEKRKMVVQKRGFKVVFHFNEGNPYFPERVLSKTYHLIQRPSSDEPEFDKIEVEKPTWNEGKNLTVKTVTKTVKSKAKGKGKKPTTRKVTEQVPNASFFNFFNAPELPEDMSTLEEEEAAEIQENLQMDLEVGQTLCEDVIPRAILWYTGVACEDEGDMDDFDDEDDVDDEDDEDGGDDDDDEDEDEDDDDDEDEDETETKKGNEKKPAGANPQDTPEECKQQ